VCVGFFVVVVFFCFFCFFLFIFYFLQKSKKLQEMDVSSASEQEAQMEAGTDDKQSESDTDKEQDWGPSYPQVPWQTVEKSSTVKCVFAKKPVGGDYLPDASYVPADGIGDLPSAFRAMHMFDESETTRLLGTKSRRVLTRHLNQVLLRGDHVVAIALVE
jgi:hypothetical protein